MKSTSLIFIICCLLDAMISTVNSFAQAPDWIWARGTGGTDQEFGQSVAADPSGTGYSYAAGWFYSDSITFGSTTLVNAGETDGYIVKYDAAGNVLWANSLASAGRDQAWAVVADAFGNCYVAGYFNSPYIDIGSNTFINQGNNDLLIVKYDQDGNVVWAKSAGEDYDDYAFAITADGSDNIYVAGIFYGATITFGSTTLTNNYVGYRDFYIVKYDADGNVIWAKSGGGIYDDNAYSVSVDAAGNSYLAGIYYSPTMTFDLITLTNNGSVGQFSDLFLMKYDPDGNVVWAKSIGSSNDEHLYSISSDASGNNYLVGRFFSPTLTFGSTTLTNLGDYNMYLAKYDADGNALWAKSYEGNTNAKCVTVDPLSSGGYFTGYFLDTTVTFDSFTLTNSSTDTSPNIFLVKFDEAGNVLWVKSADGINPEESQGVAADAYGSIYVTGEFYGPTLVFDSTTLTSGGNYDMFIAKMGDTTSPAPISAFLSSDTLLCEKFCIAFTDQSLNNPVSWLWTFEGASPATSTDQNPSNVCYDDPGVFDVTLITTNANGISDTLTLNNFITVNPNPFAPTITQSGNTLTSSFATTYQWYLDGNIIPGATDQSYTITQSGLYTVVISDENGCNSQADFNAIMLGIDSLSNDFFVSIIGDLTEDQLNIEASANGRIELEVINVVGQKLFHQTVNLNATPKAISIDISELPSGIYFLNTCCGAKSKTIKWVKE